MTDTAHAGAHGHEGADHPGPGKYAAIAVVLSAITFLEFGAFYVDALREVKAAYVTLLVVASAIKFAMVAMFYMHLKFDHGIFTRLLVTGIVLGTLVMFALLSLFFMAHPPNM